MAMIEEPRELSLTDVVIIFGVICLLVALLTPFSGPWYLTLVYLIGGVVLVMVVCIYLCYPGKRGKDRDEP